MVIFHQQTPPPQPSPVPRHPRRNPMESPTLNSFVATAIHAYTQDKISCLEQPLHIVRRTF